MNPVVLIVEEHAGLREQYERFLRDEGYEVVSTAAADELTTLAEKISPDVVVVDPDSGGGRGMEAAMHLLAAGTPASLIFNTAYPFSMETDFSTWVADAYSVRSHGVGDLGRALSEVLGHAAHTSAG